jgi:hypothetical protein
VGEWNAEATHPLFEHLMKGKIIFDWIEGNSFLLMTSDWEKSKIPNNRSIIGYDKSSNAYVMLYSDERNVLRIYEMTFNDGIWKLWRNSPGFSQRFSGTFKDNNNKFSGTWELCEDDISWKKDLEVTYTKVN